MSDLVYRLQQTLEFFYRIRGPVSVQDFCMRTEHVKSLFGERATPPPREALYVTPTNEETTDIGLYIDPQQVAQAEAFVRSPQSGTLDAFCVALEGVSHFLYLTYCSTALKRPVSQIELELQAEVDKYLLLRVLFGVKDSVSRLFRNISFHESIAPDGRERYRVANRQALRYARWMDARVRRGHISHVLDDARLFYRKPLSCKLARIAAAY